MTMSASDRCGGGITCSVPPVINITQRPPSLFLVPALWSSYQTLKQ